MKALKILTTLLLLGSILVISGEVFAKDRTTGRGTGPTIYVISQELYFDSIVLADLPMKGRFQQLVPTENGLTTEFGPGDHGHVGGRWWIDVNEDDEMNVGDKFFLCPLLGPGRPTL
jgi:hypothetical protein